MSPVLARNFLPYLLCAANEQSFSRRQVGVSARGPCLRQGGPPKSWQGVVLDSGCVREPRAHASRRGVKRGSYTYDPGASESELQVLRMSSHNLTKGLTNHVCRLGRKPLSV